MFDNRHEYAKEINDSRTLFSSVDYLALYTYALYIFRLNILPQNDDLKNITKLAETG